MGVVSALRNGNDCIGDSAGSLAEILEEKAKNLAIPKPFREAFTAYEHVTRKVLPVIAFNFPYKEVL